MSICKYFKPNMKTLAVYCSALYELEGCAAGGLLHIVLDDYNYEDGHLLWCLKECRKHPENEESELGALICIRLLDMTMEERDVFFRYWSGGEDIVMYCVFAGDCKECLTNRYVI